MKPGTRGSNSGQYALRPVALMAAMVTPWYPSMREMTLVFPGRPRSFQYARDILMLLSVASPPPQVKKKRLIDG